MTIEQTIQQETQSVSTQQSSTGPRVYKKAGLVSGAKQADSDLRKASSYVKRVAPLTMACLVRGGTKKDFEVCTELLESLTDKVMFQYEQQHGINSESRVYPMTYALISDSCATHILEFIKQTKERTISKALESLEKNLDRLSENIIFLLSDEKSQTLLQIHWPDNTSDMATATTLLIADMSPVSEAIHEWNFGLEPSHALAGASAFVRDLALDMLVKIVPEQAAPTSRMFHYQTLLKATASIYASSWKRTAAPQMHRASTLQEPELSRFMASRDKDSAREFIARIEANTLAAVQALFKAATTVGNAYLIKPEEIDKRYAQLRDGARDVHLATGQFNQLIERKQEEAEKSSNNQKVAEAANPSVETTARRGLRRI